MAGRKDKNKERPTKQIRYCGVPQCTYYRNKQTRTSMHIIPRRVLSNPIELLKWKIVLRLKKPLPKNFRICSLHFKKKEVIYPIARGQQVKGRLLDSAFPTRHLPKPPIASRLCVKKIKAKYQRIIKKKPPSEREESPDIKNEPFETTSESEIEFIDVADVHKSYRQSDKCVQVGNDLLFNTLPFQISSNDKLNTLTGIPTVKLLNKIVKRCLLICPAEKDKRGMPLQHRIILTMFRLKNNSSSAVTAVIFNLAEKICRIYYTECIQLLAKALRRFIYWQTEEEINAAYLPECFKEIPNVVTVLDCIEIKTDHFGGETCMSYSCVHIVKLLLGMAPSGLFNLISTSTAARTAEEVTYNLTSLLEKINPGDAVIVNKRFPMANELLRARIDLVCLQSESISDQLLAAREHVERQKSRIKKFKVLSEKVSYSNLCYIDKIVTVICAITNLSLDGMRR